MENARVSSLGKGMGTEPDGHLPRQHAPSGPVFSPDQVIAALIGRDGFVLEGFGGVDPALSKHVPNIPIAHFADERAQADAIDGFSKRRQRRLLTLLVSVLALAILIGVGIGAFANREVQFSGEPVSVSWHVLEVKQDGLLIQVAGAPMFFPVGGVLPSGEALIGVDFIAQSFSTENQVIALKVRK